MQLLTPVLDCVASKGLTMSIELHFVVLDLDGILSIFLVNLRNLNMSIFKKKISLQEMICLKGFIDF